MPLAPACNSRPRTKRANALQLWRWTAWWVIQLVIARPYDRTPYTGRVLVGQWGVRLEFGLHSARGILDFGDFFPFFFLAYYLGGGSGVCYSEVGFLSFIMVIHNLKDS